MTGAEAIIATLEAERRADEDEILQMVSAFAERLADRHILEAMGGPHGQLSEAIQMAPDLMQTVIDGLVAQFPTDIRATGLPGRMKEEAEEAYTNRIQDLQLRRGS